MPLNLGFRIKQELDVKGLRPMDLASKLSMSRQAVYDMLNKKHLNTELLEKVSEALDVPIGWFFTEETTKGLIVQQGNGNKNLINSQLYEQEHAALLLCEKENEGLRREVELLREMNEMLKKK